MKDRFTLFAILGALGCVFVSMFLEGSNPMVLFKPAPLLLVFGGTTCVALAGADLLFYLSQAASNGWRQRHN